MPLRVHHLVISGFRQRRRHLAGCDCLLAALDEFRRPGVRIESLEWNADMQAEAAFIARHAAEGEEPIVCLYPYSWGFGWGAIRLALALEAKGIGVYAMRVCDGVYRHGYRLGNWRALWPWSVIELPANVACHNVELFVQRHSWLRGHRVVDAAGLEITPRLIDQVIINCAAGWSLIVPATHYNLDESLEWIGSSVDFARYIDTRIDEQLQQAA